MDNWDNLVTGGTQSINRYGGERMILTMLTQKEHRKTNVKVISGIPSDDVWMIPRIHTSE